MAAPAAAGLAIPILRLAQGCGDEIGAQEIAGGNQGVQKGAQLGQQ